MPELGTSQFKNGICIYRPHGTSTLVDVVDLVSRAISNCRDQGMELLLVDLTNLVDLPLPMLVDRFLMVEDWAQISAGKVIVALVASPKHIHPGKFGVNVALHFGMTGNILATEEEASKWLLEAAARKGSP